jgi:DNA-binding GntR family transcriptional regulator
MLERGNLKDQVADYLRAAIIGGELAPAERLREIPLSRRLEVSRGPIRDAFIELTREGLLVARPKAGVTVADPPSEKLRPLLVSLRRQLELSALEVAWSENRDELISRSKRNNLLLEVSCAGEDFADVVRLDLAFHRQLVLLGYGIDGVNAWSPLIAGMRLRYGRHESFREVFEEHKRIVDALQAKDIERARRCLEAHIQ